MRHTAYSRVQCQSTDELLAWWLTNHPKLNKGEGVKKVELLDEFEAFCKKLGHECTMWGVEDFMKRAMQFGLVKIGNAKPKLARFC